MPNNFFVTGASYNSKAGSDSNNGTSPNTPKNSIGGGISINATGNHIVGEGHYSESITGNIGANITGILADGLVLVSGDSTMSWNPLSTNANLRISGINFRGLASVSGLSGSAYVRFENCSFENITAFSSSYGGIFVNCRFINCAWTGTNGARYSFDQCRFINCGIRDTSRFTNSYIDLYSSLRVQASINNANFDGNCINGTIAVGGTNYQIFSNHRVSNPTLNQNSFDLDPLFNNVTKGDLTVQAGSPLLRIDNVNIGGVVYAVGSYLDQPEWQPENGAVWYNTVRSGNDAVLTAGATEGYVRSAPKRVAAIPTRLNRVHYRGLLNYNKSTALGSVTNKNVPDTDIYAGNDASGLGNPDRLTFLMRWTYKDEIPLNDSGWENGTIYPAGQYAKLCYGLEPSVDITGKANGDAGYNPASTNPVVAVYCQSQVNLKG
jgi:hypothetical protein